MAVKLFPLWFEAEDEVVTLDLPVRLNWSLWSRRGREGGGARGGWGQEEEVGATGPGSLQIGASAGTLLPV